MMKDAGLKWKTPITKHMNQLMYLYSMLARALHMTYFNIKNMMSHENATASHAK
jgi:hypothetical protein